VILAVCLLSCLTFVLSLRADNKVYAQQKFMEFVDKYNKKYTAQEFETRFQIFQKNLQAVEQHNLNKDTFTMDVNQFSDLSQQDFESQILMKPISAESLKRMYAHIQVDNAVRVRVAVNESFDWRPTGAVTPVKNQGGCGSCWTYSTTGNLEGVNFVKNKKLVPLSQQQLVDCDKECGTDPVDGTQYCDGGCNGGWMMTAFQHIIKVGGIDTEAAYPGGSHQGTVCKFDKKNIGVMLSSWKMLSSDEETLAKQLVENGPIAVAFNAARLFAYSSGIIKASQSSCNPKVMSHAVLLVGFGEEAGTKFWIVKNSWSASWGEKGYFRIERGTNACGIATVPCTGVIA